MLLSNTHRFVFFATPKTGSTSVLACLAQALPEVRRSAEGPLDVGDLMPPHDWKGREIGSLRKHMSPDELRRVLPNYDDYYSFCFLRNPWSWMVSYYHFLRVLEVPAQRVAPGTEPHPIFRRIRTANALNFDAWVPWFLADSDPRRPFGRFLFNPDGSQAVDFVGRYERLGEDLSVVAERVGLTLAELPHLNASRHGPYADYYRPKTRDLVARYFEREIAHLGYSFGR